MNGSVAHAVALVCHGNAYLRGLRALEPFAANSTMRFVASIHFDERPSGRSAEVEAATSVESWLEELRRRRCARLALRCTSHLRFPQTAALAPAGDGPWQVVSEGPGRAKTLWCPVWEVGDREEAERRIWRVGYLGQAAVDDAPPPPGLEACHDALLGALEPIRAFSLEFARGAAIEAFDGARSTLERGEPRGFHRDLAPEGVLPPLATRLLDACQVGWVFGGMGFWNDAVYDGEVGRRFEQVTHAYWRALTEAIVAATTASGSSA